MIPRMTVRASSTPYAMAGLLFAGCAGSVTGTVGGETPGVVLSGYWYYVTDAEGAVTVAAVLSTVSNACAVESELWSRWIDTLQGAASGLDFVGLDEALDSIQRDLVPSEYWDTTMTFFAGDRDDVVGEGYEIGGDASLTVVHHTDYVEFDDVLFDAGAWNVEVATGQTGTAVVTSFDPDGTLAGEAEAVLADGDGEVAAKFRVGRCTEFEAVLDDVASLDWFGL